jgi:hypothetical protein
MGSIQVKSVNKPFLPEHGYPLETRHIKLWGDVRTGNFVVVLWSVKERKFRFRNARSIIEELDKTKPNWRNQGEVKVKFRTSDEFLNPLEAMSFLKRDIESRADFR